MPSPACQVKDGAGSYQPTTNGVDVTAGATITIDLIDKSVDSWALTCLTTDEMSSAATPNAALAASINPVTKRATYTAPAQGRTYRFRSIVDGGIDANNRPRASYTTTFCVYVPVAVTGRRVIAADETTEGSALFGWIAAINDLLRNPTTAVAIGAGDALQASDGSGGMADSGLTGASGVLGATTVNATTINANGDITGGQVSSDVFASNDNSKVALSFVGSSLVLGSAGVTAIRPGVPILGNSNPYAAHGNVSFNMGGADYAALSSEYDKLVMIEANSATFGAVSHALTLPDAAAGGAYCKWLWNPNSANMVVSDTSHPGTTISISSGRGCWVVVTSSGCYRMSAEVDPTV